MRFLVLNLLLLVALTMIGCNERNKKKLYIYNWADYIPDEVKTEFEKETGIELVYETYDSNETMYTKIKTLKNGGYDIVVPSTYYVSRMAKEGLLMKIDKQKVSNFKNLDNNLLNKEYDPNNDHSIPYLWGTTGIGINTKKINPEKVTGWVDLWNTDFQKQVSLVKDSRDVFFMALRVLGYSENETDRAKIEKAYEYLKKLKPNLHSFNTESPKDVFITGEVSIGMIYNGEAFKANEENPDIQYIYPKEGAVLWIDSMVIPKTAENIEQAYQFINFILRPEIGKKICQGVGYATPNAESIKLLDEKLRNNRIIYPSEKDLKNAGLEIDLGETFAIYQKYFNSFVAND